MVIGISRAGESGMSTKERPPEIGDPAPDFELASTAGEQAQGTPFRLSEAVREGALVLVFYRGFR